MPRLSGVSRILVFAMPERGGDDWCLLGRAPELPLRTSSSVIVIVIVTDLVEETRMLVGGPATSRVLMDARL